MVRVGTHTDTGDHGISASATSAHLGDAVRGHRVRHEMQRTGRLQLDPVTTDIESGADSGATLANTRQPAIAGVPSNPITVLFLGGQAGSVQRVALAALDGMTDLVEPSSEVSTGSAERVGHAAESLLISVAVIAAASDVGE